ncbi:MAG: aminoglycoside phosphotransferase family protein [Anaerolineae bacterium]|nr:aminoglycoside phosphotransferase family protein [Anaerolineae bacterium]
MSDLQSYAQWIHQQATTADIQLTAAIEPVKLSASATILRVPSDRGSLFFKAPMASFAFEGKLTAALARWFPAALPRVIAVEESFGWLLMEDAGTTLKQRSQEHFEVEQWVTMLREFARLQQAAIQHMAALAEIGVPDRRLNKLPALYQELLTADDRGAVLLLDQPDGITSADLNELHAAVAQVKALCTQLTSFNIPETLHHDDFHVGNVTVRDDRIMFIDWGESCLAHPFFSLMLALRYAKLVFNCDDARLDELRDAYLEGWIDYASLTELRQAFTVAAQLGALCRTLTWVQVARGVGAEDRAEYADAAPYWLLTFLRNTPFQA